MAILNKYLNPTTGQPGAAKLEPRRRRRNMTEEDFYLDQQRRRPQLFVESPEITGPESTSVDQFNQPQFINQPVTGAYIEQQLKNIANRPAVPHLSPGSRVQSPNTELVKPSNFKGFYDQLGIITGIGEEALAAERARAAARQQQQLQALFNTIGGGGGSTGGSNNRGGGRAYGNGIPSNPQANFRFAQQIAPRYGWGPQELSAWYTLGMKESGWRNTAQNPTSTAYGIGQFLDSTWRTVGGTKTSDPRAQVDYMARYIKQRYGSPSRALAFHYRNNWY